MATRAFLAFEDPQNSFDIEELFYIDNQSDRIVLNGELHITKDKEGLAKLLELKRVITAAESALKARGIPQSIHDTDGTK